jgi:hypothetical protein
MYYIFYYTLCDTLNKYKKSWVAKYLLLYFVLVNSVIRNGFFDTSSQSAFLGFFMVSYLDFRT